MTGGKRPSGPGQPGATARLTPKALLAGHWPAVLLVVSCSVLAAALEITPALIVAEAVDRLMTGRAEEVAILAAGLLAATLAAFAMQMISALVSHLLAIDIQAALRRAIGSQLLNAPLGDVEQLEPAAIRRVLIEDVERLEDGIAHLVPDLAAALVAPIVVIAVMICIDWRLALAAVAPITLGFVLFSTVLRDDQGLSRRFSEAQAEIAEALQEAVSMVPVIKAFNLRQSALRRPNRAFAEFQGVVGEWLAANMTGATSFFLATTSTLVFVLPLGLYLFQTGETDMATLVFFALAALGLTSISGRLFGAMGRLRLQEAALTRISGLLALPQLPAGEKIPDAGDLRIENLCFSYGKGFALSDITIDIPAGSRIALVGPSGSGKSTLARLLLRHHDPDKGRITLAGTDLREFDPEALAHKMSAVFQEVFLFSRSIRQNIALGKSNATNEEIKTAAHRAQADTFIQATDDGYDTVLNRGEGLSGGQRQRISLARALLKDAPIVVLDEATAYADPASEFEIQRALDEVMHGKTVIAVAHRLSSIRHFDRIYYLMDGHVAEQGTHEELLALNGHYARQWRAHLDALGFRL